MQKQENGEGCSFHGISPVLVRMALSGVFHTISSLSPFVQGPSIHNRRVALILAIGWFFGVQWLVGGGSAAI